MSDARAEAASGRPWQPVDPPRRPVLFLNPRSGAGAETRAAVIAQARRRGIETVTLAPGQDLAALAREALAGGADALGVAAGDGSLRAVAAVAAAAGVPFVCIPAGTRNHFALDLGVDRRDPVGALEAFTEGLERRVDVGEVDGHLFLNNVSLGVYGRAVGQPAYRDAKLRTLLETAEAVLGPSGAATALRVVDDLGDEHVDPAVVLVSNNPYALDVPLARGLRPALDTGRLGVVVLDAPGAAPRRRARAWTTPRLEIAGTPPILAGVDGESVTLAAPLRCASRPAALRVRIAARHALVPSAARHRRRARRAARPR
jgi:diacylglycerol kinase family enzyme